MRTQAHDLLSEWRVHVDLLWGLLFPAGVHIGVAGMSALSPSVGLGVGVRDPPAGGQASCPGWSLPRPETGRRQLGKDVLTGFYSSILKVCIAHRVYH